MKFGVLRSIGHNISDSLASGIGLMIGVYHMDIFAEAAASEGGFIEVDFLAGTTAGGAASPLLARAVFLYAEALNDLCARQGAARSDFGRLTARFSIDLFHRRFIVTVEDRNGRSSTDHYIGVPGKRPWIRDRLGRIRRAPGAHSRSSTPISSS